MKRLLVLGVAVVVGGAAEAARADVYTFAYTSTTNNSYNGWAHLRNTGIHVNAGDVLHITGTDTINFGQYVLATNFQMGLVSPLTTAELQRDFSSAGPGDWHAAPIPLAGEAALFAQDRAFQLDIHDVDLTMTAPQAGNVYVGVYDSYYGDNLGTHHLTFQVTPEPGTLALMAVGALALFRRRR